jgi:hypothetical protein
MDPSWDTHQYPAFAAAHLAKTLIFGIRHDSTNPRKKHMTQKRTKVWVDEGYINIISIL